MRLLLAEDEVALARAIAKIFEKNNYSIDVVHDGQDALSDRADELDEEVDFLNTGRFVSREFEECRSDAFGHQLLFHKYLNII